MIDSYLHIYLNNIHIQIIYIKIIPIHFELTYLHIFNIDVYWYCCVELAINYLYTLHIDEHGFIKTSLIRLLIPCITLKLHLSKWPRVCGFLLIYVPKRSRSYSKTSDHAMEKAVRWKLSPLGRPSKKASHFPSKMDTSLEWQLIKSMFSYHNTDGDL